MHAMCIAIGYWTKLLFGIIVTISYAECTSLIVRGLGPLWGEKEIMDGTTRGDKSSRAEAELCLSGKVTQLVAPFDNHDHPQLGCTSLPR